MAHRRQDLNKYDSFTMDNVWQSLDRYSKKTCGIMGFYVQKSESDSSLEVNTGMHPLTRMMV